LLLESGKMGRELLLFADGFWGSGGGSRSSSRRWLLLLLRLGVGRLLRLLTLLLSSLYSRSNG
jgi:hypothetical protein